MRPSHAESTRTLVADASRGVLSTLLAGESDEDTAKPAGHPYGSLVEVAGLEGGDVLMFLSDLADHTKNLKADGRASLLVSEGFAADNPLADERATLLGDIERVERSDALRETYLEVHPHASAYIDFSDFNFYRLAPDRIRYVGGFGRMSWLEGDDYRAAAPDPLRHAAPGAIEHMNEDHVDAMVAMVRHFTDHGDAPVSDVRMVRLDKCGFDLEVISGEGSESRKTRGRERIAFPEPVDQPGRLRGVMAEMTNTARDKG